MGSLVFPWRPGLGVNSSFTLAASIIFSGGGTFQDHLQGVGDSVFFFGREKQFIWRAKILDIFEFLPVEKKLRP